MKPPAAPHASMRPPPVVGILGYGGLIPFITSATFRWLNLLGRADQWLLLLVAYGAVILSFVGALHWGFAMMAPGVDRARRTQCYVWSVIPALIGIAAIGLNSSLSLTLLVSGFALAYWQDAALANRISLPAWYPRLRAHLSIVACVCLLSGLIPAA